MAGTFATAEEYIDSFPDQIRGRLETVRRIALDVVPGGGERISYGMPTVTLNGRDVVLYSGWKRHVSIYPAPSGDEALDRDLVPYRASKGTLRFRHDRPLPEDLVRRVVAALLAIRAPDPTR
jgi:uncharacterized protein YdhG (YjbR/CyaY superfamily)